MRPAGTASAGAPSGRAGQAAPGKPGWAQYVSPSIRSPTAAPSGTAPFRAAILNGLGDHLKIRPVPGPAGARGRIS